LRATTGSRQSTNASTGSPDAFWERWRQYEESLRRIIVRLVQNIDTAEEVLQDTLIKAQAAYASGGYVEGGAFLAWLKQIARNVYLDLIRRPQPAPLDDEVYEFASPDPTPEEEAILHDLLDRLRTALKECFTATSGGPGGTIMARLKEIAFVLYYADGYTLDEVSVIVSAEMQRHGLGPLGEAGLNNWLGGGRLVKQLAEQLVRQMPEALEKLDDAVIERAGLTDDELDAWSRFWKVTEKERAEQADKTVARLIKSAEKKIGCVLAKLIAADLHKTRLS
jgi:hypothetical protein